MSNEARTTAINEQPPTNFLTCCTIPAQIAEAQNLAREWWVKHPKKK